MNGTAQAVASQEPPQTQHHQAQNNVFSVQTSQSREVSDDANDENPVDLRSGIDPGDPLTKRGRIKKRKRDQNADGDQDPHDPERYRYKVYHIRRAFTLYGHIPSIINNGIKRRAKAAANEDVRDIQSDADYETFLSIINHLEGFDEDIMRLKQQPAVFRTLVRKIREAADQARNNDTANLKKDIACMLTPDGQCVLRPVRKGMKASSKNDRGFENDVMGKYLCPVSLDWDNPSVREEVRDGKHAIVAGDWPRLLYAGLECNLDDMEIGLGRNMALVRVVKYLFTGRSSAFSDTAGGKTTRSGNAALAGMTEITPKVVAYGACMLRFAISNEESWTKLEKEFNMEDFYWGVVGIFEESGRFGEDLLTWWNLQVFGTSEETSKGELESTSKSSLSLLKSQRAAKRARLACSDSEDKENETEAPHTPITSGSLPHRSSSMLPLAYPRYDERDERNGRLNCDIPSTSTNFDPNRLPQSLLFTGSPPRSVGFLPPLPPLTGSLLPSLSNRSLPPLIGIPQGGALNGLHRPPNANGSLPLPALAIPNRPTQSNSALTLPIRIPPIQPVNVTHSSMLLGTNLPSFPSHESQTHPQATGIPSTSTSIQLPIRTRTPLALSSAINHVTDNSLDSTTSVIRFKTSNLRLPPPSRTGAMPGLGDYTSCRG